MFKTTMPKFTDAAGFHKLADDRTAMAFYLEGMDDGHSYFHDLVRF
jgi:hypothetical protein